MIPGAKVRIPEGSKAPFSYSTVFGDVNLHVVHTMPEWEEFFRLLNTQKRVACDTETTGFHYFKGDKIVGMSFGWKKDHFYVPVRHVDSETGGEQPPQLDMDALRPDLQKFFSRRDVDTIWHNAKFDMHFFKADGIDIKTPFHDTTFLWQFYDENAPNALKMIASGWTDVMKRRHKGLIGPGANKKEKELSEWRANEAKVCRNIFKKAVMARADDLQEDLRFQGMRRNDLKKWIVEHELHDHEYNGILKEDIHYGFVPIFPLMTEYASIDTYLTYHLYDFLMKEVKFTKDLTKVYLNELKLCKALFDIEEGGVQVNPGYLKDLEAELRHESEEAERKIREQFPEKHRNLNLGSNDQLALALKDMDVPLNKTTASGKLCVDKKILVKLQKDYPIIKDFLDYRETNKLLTTYAISIQNLLTDKHTIHMSFNQNVTTGRMSCRDPNIQNVPRGDTRIRNAFVVPGGYVFVFSDYSQVEVRLTAHYSEDPLMLDAYAKDQDIHSRTACEMFDVDYDEFVVILGDDQHESYKQMKDYRSIAKTINFGIIYGVGAPGLSGQIPRPERYIGLPDSAWVEACQAYIDQYFERYKGVKRFVNRCKRIVGRHGEIANHFGRVRHLPAVNADKYLGAEAKWMVGQAKRQAANFVIQGTAADIFKFATVRVHEEVYKNTDARIVNLVHDEIQSYIPVGEFSLLKKQREVMEDFDFLVPLKVDFAYSQTSWGTKKELAA